MSNQIKVGHYEADTGLINLPLGFIPDVFDMDEAGTANPDHVRWYRQQEIAEADAAQGGMRTDGNSGQISRLSAANGIIAYNTGSQKPAIGIWEGSSATIDDRAGNTITIVARTVTAPGTYVNPTVGSSTDRQAVFECVATSGSTASSEPTWPDSIGENVVDGSVTWKRVNVSLQRGGYQGVVISANLNSNNEWYYEAVQTDQSVDHGDTGGWTDGIDPDA